MKGRPMNTVKFFIAVAMAAVMLNGFVVVVSADGAKAESKSEVVCETGTYGQKVNCKATSSAKAKVVVTREGVPTHQVAATGLNAQGVAAVIGTVSTGLVATIARFRLGK